MRGIWRRRPPKDDRELEQQTGIKPADHHFVTPAAYREARKQLLGPSWGKKRRKMR